LTTSASSRAVSTHQRPRQASTGAVLSTHATATSTSNSTSTSAVGSRAGSKLSPTPSEVVVVGGGGAVEGMGVRSVTPEGAGRQTTQLAPIAGPTPAQQPQKIPGKYDSE
jgi:hypothetical protein